jgi:hypothetical protein
MYEHFPIYTAPATELQLSIDEAHIDYKFLLLKFPSFRPALGRRIAYFSLRKLILFLC